MKCILDRTPLELMGSRVTDDEKQVVSTYVCPKCFRRVTQREANPRYVAAPKPEPDRTPPRSYQRHAIACQQCGEPMAERTPDGLCSLCARNAA